MSPVARDVRAAAQLGAERAVADRHDADLVAVLFAEQRHRAAAIASCVLRTLVLTGVVLQDRVVDDPLDSRSLLAASTAEKCTKSKRSRSGATSEPACLTCAPEHLAKRGMQQVRRRVIAARGIAHARHRLRRSRCRATAIVSSTLLEPMRARQSGAEPHHAGDARSRRRSRFRSSPDPRSGRPAST